MIFFLHVLKRPSPSWDMVRISLHSHSPWASSDWVYSSSDTSPWSYRPTAGILITAAGYFYLSVYELWKDRGNISRLLTAVFSEPCLEPSTVHTVSNLDLLQYLHWTLQSCGNLFYWRIWRIFLFLFYPITYRIILSFPIIVTQMPSSIFIYVPLNTHTFDFYSLGVFLVLPCSTHRNGQMTLFWLS